MFARDVHCACTKDLHKLIQLRPLIRIVRTASSAMPECRTDAKIPSESDIGNPIANNTRVDNLNAADTVDAVHLFDATRPMRTMRTCGRLPLKQCLYIINVLPYTVHY
uniref:SFRICE_034127 n=1 Tax=Spodoptera frugiperda TaxID=7108 RepID=A0A2H1WGM2_SPOFR